MYNAFYKKKLDSIIEVSASKVASHPTGTPNIKVDNQINSIPLFLLDYPKPLTTKQTLLTNRI